MTTGPAGAPEASDARDPIAPSDAPRPGSPALAGDGVRARESIDAICPYLVSADGGWRGIGPEREHRCWAVDPPAPLATDKQRDLCLSSEHATCPTFQAARAARAAAIAPGVDPAVVAAMDAARRPVARAAPVVLEPPRRIDRILRLPFERGPGQLLLVALMIIAFAAVGIARLSAGGPDGTGAVPSASASPSPTASPTPRPTPRLTPTPVPSASASPSPSTAAVTPEPSFRTYTVQANDTLVGIAGTYGTTAAAIRELNGLEPGAILRIGQVLKIP